MSKKQEKVLVAVLITIFAIYQFMNLTKSSNNDTVVKNTNTPKISSSKNVHTHSPTSASVKYDKLQQLYLDLNPSMSYKQMLHLVKSTGLQYSEASYADIYGMTGDAQLTNTYSLQSGARKISFDLPQRYRLIDGDDSDPAFAGFNEELKPELVYCSLQEAIDDETAEDYVLDELVEDEACPEELRTRAYLKHEVIEGRLYYYYIFKYKKSRKQRQKFAAACDIGGGLFYTIETEWIWRKEELTLEALIDFLKIRVE